MNYISDTSGVSDTRPLTLSRVLQLTFQANDQRTIKYIADEIKIFESISHPNLVKYYGTEVHRVSPVVYLLTFLTQTYLFYLKIIYFR